VARAHGIDKGDKEVESLFEQWPDRKNGYLLWERQPTEASRKLALGKFAGRNCMSGNPRYAFPAKTPSMPAGGWMIRLFTHLYGWREIARFTPQD
jgi:hypothetical protein